MKMEKSVLTQELLQAHEALSLLTKPAEVEAKASVANRIMVKFFEGEYF